jgi:hypothetical protein
MKKFRHTEGWAWLAIFGAMAACVLMDIAAIIWG